MKNPPPGCRATKGREYLNRGLICCALIMLSTLTIHTVVESRDASPNLAILQLKSIGLQATAAETLTEALQSEFVRLRQYIVLDRSNIKQLLEEQQMQQTDCTDAACAVKAGKILNSHWVVVGSVSRLEDTYLVVTNIVDVESSRIVNSAQIQQSTLTAVAKAIPALVKELVAATASSHESKDSAKSETTDVNGGNAAIAPKSPALAGGGQTIPQNSLPPVKGGSVKTATPPAPMGATKHGSPPTIELVRVHAGQFTMGASYNKNFPSHQVTITRSFYMSATEITKAEFRKFVAETGYITTAERTGGAYELMTENRHTEFKKKAGRYWDDCGIKQIDDHPVVSISWFDGLAFCNWLSQKQGLDPCYSGKSNEIECNFNAGGYRLPSEAEWEYACRSGAEAESWSFKLADMEKLGWFISNSQMKGTFTGPNPTTWNALDTIGESSQITYHYLKPPTTQSVGKKQKNGWGLYDMLGNAWEWCWDWSNRVSDPIPAQENPSGPASSTDGMRVVRGGSYLDKAMDCRPSSRSSNRPLESYSNLGFRIVRNEK